MFLIAVSQCKSSIIIWVDNYLVAIINILFFRRVSECGENVDKCGDSEGDSPDIFFDKHEVGGGEHEHGADGKHIVEALDAEVGRGREREVAAHGSGYGAYTKDDGSPVPV